MKKNAQISTEQIHLLNTTVHASTLEDNNIRLIQKFTEAGAKILKADFGFAWWKLEGKYKLAHVTKNTPHNMSMPRVKSDANAVKKRGNSFFDSNVKPQNYEPVIDSKLKSYIIISIHYGEHVFGSIILCYKNRHDFSEEELILSNSLGNAMAQAMTIHWLIESERDALELAGKQKETEVLLSQEKLKTEFIANTTHEFRTPLAIMRGQMELALRKKGSEKEQLQAAKKAIKEATKEITRLSDMRSDLVLIAATKNSKNVLNNEKINLRELFEDISGRLETLTDKNKVSIKISAPPNAYLTGDKKHMDRLFSNLMGNAVSYSKENGKVEVKVKEDKKNTVINIIDNGVGISKADLPNIFERFYRGDKSHHSEGGHSGLGLSIVKQIVDMYGGKVEVISTLGEGSTFTVYLPKKASNKPRKS